jgi:hypothetical protein
MLLVGMNIGGRRFDMDLAARLLAQTVEHDAIPPKAVGLASASFQSKLRSRLLTGMLQLLDTHRDYPVHFFRLMHPDWELPVHKLKNGKAQVGFRRQLRLDLRRSGVTATPGFLIAYNDVEFNPVDHTMQMYFACVAAGPKADKLQTAVLGDGQWTSSAQRIDSKVHPFSLDTTAAALGRFWPIQTWGEFGYRLEPDNRLIDPELQLQYQRYYLSWLDDQQFLDLFLFDGIELWDGEMHLTQEDPELGSTPRFTPD